MAESADYPHTSPGRKLTITLDELEESPRPRQTAAPESRGVYPPAAAPYVPVLGAAAPRVEFHTPAGRGIDAPPRAGFWKRFWALCLDGLVLSIPFGLAIVALIFLLGIFGLVLAPFVSIAYFTFFEGGPRGQTPGKAALGIRVVSRATGAPIGYGTALGRQLARIFSAIPFDLGYFWMLWDRDCQTWHDKLTDTIVVPVEAFPLSR
jgi:uncharacterized RDD family membrane protein YckC